MYEGFSKDEIIQNLLHDHKEHKYYDYFKTKSCKDSLNNYIKSKTTIHEFDFLYFIQKIKSTYGKNLKIIIGLNNNK